jgi:ABC-type polysaccharide/polyol phosphate export permease
MAKSEVGNPPQKIVQRSQGVVPKFFALLSLVRYYTLANYRTRKLNMLYLIVEPAVQFAVYYVLLYLVMGRRSEEMIWHFIVGIFVFGIFRNISGAVSGARQKYGGIIANSDISIADSVLVNGGVAMVNTILQLTMLIVFVLAFGKLDFNPMFFVYCAILVVFSIGYGLIGLVLRAWFMDLAYFYSETYRIFFFTSGLLFTGLTMPSVLVPYANYHPLLVGVDYVRRTILGEPGFEVQLTFYLWITLAVFVLGVVLLRLFHRRVRNVQ